jgi:hypothetical protein
MRLAYQKWEAIQKFICLVNQIKYKRLRKIAQKSKAQDNSITTCLFPEDNQTYNV